MESPEPTQFKHYLPYLQTMARQHPGQHHKPIALNQWARRLGCRSPSLLTMILNGKRLPSGEMIQRLGRDLGHTERQRRYFELLVRMERLKDRGEPLNQVLKELEQLRPTNTVKEISPELFQWISEWHHFAIKQLVESPDFVEDSRWIRSRLRNKVTSHEIRRAIATLLQVGLLTRDSNGKLKAAHPCTRFPADLGNLQMRRHIQQMLERGIEALNEQPVGQREYDVTTFRMKANQLKAFKKEVRDFRTRMMSRFHDPKANSVWQLNFSVFQHTNDEIKKRKSKTK